MKRLRRRWKIVLGIVATLLFALVWAAWPGKSTFTVSPETTYVTGPLDKDGDVDYVTALNERLSQGVTPENNANVLIWQALGPRPEGGDGMPEEYWKWLGIGPPPAGGGNIASLENCQRARGATESPAELMERWGPVTRHPWAADEKPELAEWLKRNERPLLQ